MSDPAPSSARNSDPTRPAPTRRDPASDTTGPATVPSGDAPASDPELDKLFSPPEGPDEIGRLGGYRVLKLLGRGGMGAVFAADEVALDRYVAIKVMLPELAARPEARARFVNEAKRAAKVDHDNVVPIYRVDEANGVPFIAMPLLTGVMLEDRMRHEPRPTAAEILQVAREVAAGLAAAHDKGVIHRDIKPGNVWLEARPAGVRVRLLDFGLARVCDGDQQSTFRGTLVGTPAYMSPEQADGRPLDGRTDLFSLGCVLYRMASGTSPFQRDSLLATLKAVGEHEPPPLTAVRPDLPRSLAAVVERLLAKDAERRPASAAEVLQLLRDDAPQSGWWNVRRRAAAASVAACSAVALVAGRWFWDRGPSQHSPPSSDPRSTASTLIPRVPPATVAEADDSPRKIMADIAGEVAVIAADRQIAATRLEPVVVHPDLGLTGGDALTAVVREELVRKGLDVTDEASARVLVQVSRSQEQVGATPAAANVLPVKIRVRLLKDGGQVIDLTYYRRLHMAGLR